jgi:predicted RNA binding protein YcfA (HicA-like mRNA interferase family)
MGHGAFRDQVPEGEAFAPVQLLRAVLLRNGRREGGGKQVRELAARGLEGRGEVFRLGASFEGSPMTLNPRSKMRLPDLIRKLEADGWIRVRLRGPHRQYIHPVKTGLLTIRRHLSDELAPGAVFSVLLQAGLVP